MVGPRIGEVWADRKGREWGPLEKNDGSGYLKDDYYFIAPDPTYLGISRAWAKNGGYYATGTESNFDLVELVRQTEAEAREASTGKTGGDLVQLASVLDHEKDMPAPLDGLTATLIERNKTHGEYKSHARVTQALKAVIRTGDTYGRCSDHEKETLDMIAHKIGRIVSGDPHFTDHWHDIAGYARLSEERNK